MNKGIVRRWWLPSLGVMLWLVFFWGVSYSPWRVRLISADGDAGLHWRLGSWMSEHGEVIRVDSFSYTRPEGVVVSKEWLSELLWGAAGRCWGWNGIVFVAGLLIATTLYLLYRQMETEGTDGLTATLLVLTAALACSLHWLARPLLFTHLLVVVFNWLLRGFERRRVPEWVLFASLVPLMGLWANLHGAFPVGLVLIGVYVAGDSGKAVQGQPGGWRRAVVLGALWLLCGMATLANPNGWRLHQMIIYYLRRPEFVGGVSEFLAPDFHAAYMWGFEAQLLVLAVVLLVMRGQWEATEILLVIVWGYFALHSVRNVPIFGLVVAPICAGHIRRYLQEGASGRGAQWYRRLAGDITSVSLASDGRVWIGLVVAMVLLLESGKLLKQVEPLPSAFPVGAVRFLREHPEVGRGRMFNPDHWGGYLLLEMPERKVFLDSRHEFYGTELLADYRRVVEGEPEWLETLTKYQVEWTLMPAGHPLNQLLALRREWRRMYADRAATIYCRQ
ncbi:MAG: hypothetical protein ABSA97_10045 [Verrucomicrobiia bacterium]